MITAYIGTSVSLLADFPAIYAGLVGTIGYTLRNNVDDSVYVARTTAGIRDKGNGAYIGTLTGTEAWSGYVEWDTGGETPAATAREEIVIVAAPLTASAYTAPDNAGIAAIPTLAEIEASTVLAKEATVNAVGLAVLDVPTVGEIREEMDTNSSQLALITTIADGTAPNNAANAANALMMPLYASTSESKSMASNIVLALAGSTTTVWTDIMGTLINAIAVTRNYGAIVGDIISLPVTADSNFNNHLFYDPTASSTTDYWLVGASTGGMFRLAVPK